MAATADTVARALTATLSNLAADRQSAEALLSQLAANDDHAAHLLHLAASNLPLVSQAAALRLKNLSRYPRPASTHTASHTSSSSSSLSEPARANVREHILHALSLSRASPVEGILAETMHWLVLRDFPARWPSLLQQVSSFLSSGDATRVHAALVALRQVVKCYEFKTRNPDRLDKKDPNDTGLAHPREPLESIAAACFPSLLNLYTHLDQIVAAPSPQQDSQQQQVDSVSKEKDVERNHAAYAQRLIVKVFWSCIQFILPPCLAEGDCLDRWMTALLTTMRRPCRLVIVDDPEDLNSVPEWKTKKWIATVLNRFLKRYGSPKKIPVEESWAHTIAEAFKLRYAETTTSVMLEVVSSTTEGQQVSRRVAHLALDYIEEAIETAQLWAVIKTRVDTLLTQVIFSYLCFSEVDQELWLNDPGEYVRKQYDLTEDLTSPRMAACNLLSKMADLRSKRTILPFLQHLMNAVLEPYAAAPTNSAVREQLARQKVGAFAALAAVRVKLVSKKELADSLMSVLKQHVIPDLKSEYGFVRSEAAWLLGQVAACGWEAFSVQLGEQVLRGCVALLEDPHVPVQASAAGALQYLMEQDGASVLIEPVAPQLLERLLQLMDQMADGYASLLPAVDKLVERYPSHIMPVSLPLVQRLMAAFTHSAQGILRDDGGEDDDDDLVFTAAQVLHLISSILSAVGEWEEAPRNERARLLLALENQLQPVLSDMFNESHQVFVEELLDVLGILVVQLGHVYPNLSPFLLSLIPKMAAGFDRWAADYVEQMLDAIEGYLTFATPELLRQSSSLAPQSTPPLALLSGTAGAGAAGAGTASADASGCTGMACFVHMVDKLWSDKFDSSDAEYGAKIAEWMVINIGKAIQSPTFVQYRNQLNTSTLSTAGSDSHFGSNSVNAGSTASNDAGDQRTRRRENANASAEEKARSIVVSIGCSAAHRLVRAHREYEEETGGSNRAGDNGKNNSDDKNNDSEINHGGLAFSLAGLTTHLSDRLFCVLMNSCFVAADDMLLATGSQPLMHLVDQHTRDLDYRFDRTYAKKSVMLGLCALLVAPPPGGGVLMESKPHLLRIILSLHSSLTKRRKPNSGGATSVGEEDNGKVVVDEVSISDVSPASRSGGGGGKLSINGGLSPFMDANDFYGLGGIGKGVNSPCASTGKDKDAGSDLEDDEDASNMMEELNERQQVHLQRMANGDVDVDIEVDDPSLGLDPAALGVDQGNTRKFYDFLDLAIGGAGAADGESDEENALNMGVHALDDVDEMGALVAAVKWTARDEWWSMVPGEQRGAVEVLVRKEEEKEKEREREKEKGQGRDGDGEGQAGGGGVK